MVKKVIFCFNSEEANEIRALERRLRWVHEDKGHDPNDLEIKIIYPCDIVADKYMTWEGTDPTNEAKKTLASLTPEDKIYVWGHGAPNYPYISGSIYTEFAEYLEKGLNKDNFGPDKGALKIAIESCNGGRGGKQGVNSYAGRLHALLGKKGIHASVSGRLRNVSVDLGTLAMEGIKTIERSMDGLEQAKIYKSKSSHKRKAARSKVLYEWMVTDPNKQIRIDSYRKSAFNDFVSLKRSLLQEISTPYSQILYPGKLHKILLTIELNLGQLDKSPNMKNIESSFKLLHAECLAMGLTETSLKKLGFDDFKETLVRKATSAGLVTQETGVNIKDPLLEIEKQSMHDFINNQPSFMELDRLVKVLKQNETNETSELAEIIGSSKTCGGEDLYATFFLLSRCYNLINNDGKLTIPEEVEKTMNLINRMLHLAYESDQPLRVRQAEMQSLKKKLVNFKNADYKFDYVSSLEEAEPEEGVVYFERTSDNLIKYKVKKDDEVHSDVIHLSQLEGLPKKVQKKLESGDLSALDAVKDKILNITSKRGHTSKELTFWGKIQVIFRAIKSSVKDVLGEYHEASKLETFGNLFHNSYEYATGELQEHTEQAEVLHKIISACENKISLPKQEVQNHALSSNYNRFGFMKKNGDKSEQSSHIENNPNKTGKG